MHAQYGCVEEDARAVGVCGGGSTRVEMRLILIWVFFFSIKPCFEYVWRRKRACVSGGFSMDVWRRESMRVQIRFIFI